MQDLCRGNYKTIRTLELNTMKDAMFMNRRIQNCMILFFFFQLIHRFSAMTLTVLIFPLIQKITPKLYVQEQSAKNKGKHS